MSFLSRLVNPRYRRPGEARRALPNATLAARLAADPLARTQVATALAAAPRYRDAVVATRRDWLALSWELDGTGLLERVAAVGPTERGRLASRVGGGREALAVLAEALRSGRALIAPSLKRDETELLGALPESGRLLWEASLRVDPAEAVDLLLDPPAPAGPALARAAGEPGGIALAARELERRDPRSEPLRELIAAARRRDPLARARLAALAWRDVLAPRLAPFAGALADE
jgi:hypothetical protein